jgi:hypothetical protein
MDSALGGWFSRAWRTLSASMAERLGMYLLGGEKTMRKLSADLSALLGRRPLLTGVLEPGVLDNEPRRWGVLRRDGVF